MGDSEAATAVVLSDAHRYYVLARCPGHSFQVGQGYGDYVLDAFEFIHQDPFVVERLEIDLTDTFLLEKS